MSANAQTRARGGMQPFTADLSGAVFASALAVVVAVGLGLVGTWRILSQKPAPYLRNL